MSKASIEDIQQLKKWIKDNWALCQLFEGTYAACEAEIMVAQTVHAAVANYKEFGEAFSWKGKGVERPRDRAGTDNATAYQMLLKRGYFIEQERDERTIIVITQKLVDLLDKFFSKKELNNES